MEIRRGDKKMALALLAKHFHLRREETLLQRFLTALRGIF